MLIRIISAVITLTVASLTPVLAQTEPAPMPTPERSGYAPVNGVDFYFAVYGSGPPIVLLHGGLMSGSGFAPILETFAAEHRVVTIDLQGHGHTLPFDRPMTFEAMADDVAGVIDYLDLGQTAVLGYSMGATTALRLAIQHPDKVSRLVHVSAPYSFAEGWHDYNLEVMRGIDASAAEGMLGSPMYETYVAEAPDPANFPTLLDKIGDMMRAGFDYSGEIGTLQTPTMLVYGDWDAVRISHAAKFFELLGGGLQDAGWDGSGMNANRLAILPGLTHYGMISPRLAETALGFIDAP